MIHRSLLLGTVAVIVVLAGGGMLSATAQDAASLPLSAQGPYGVGVETFDFVDESRDGRVVSTLIWYPAEAGPNSYLMGQQGAKPITTGAPYPLVIYSHHLGSNNTGTLGVGPHLASYGFVVASANHNDPEPAWPNLIERPYDVLFVLDQLTALSTGPLAGIIDTDRVGVTGYSFGGSTAVQLAGATIHPVYFIDWCTENHPDDLAATPPNSTVLGRTCLNIASRWNEVTAYRARYEPPLVEGEAWPALTDERIVAVLPMAVCGLPQFGPEGLSEPTIPMFYLMPERDDLCGNEDPIGLVRQILDVPDRYLLTVLRTTHTGLLDRENFKLFRHFETAFFGFYLQGNADYARYLTPEALASVRQLTLEVGE